MTLARWPHPHDPHDKDKMLLKGTSITVRCSMTKDNYTTTTERITLLPTITGRRVTTPLYSWRLSTPMATSCKYIDIDTSGILVTLYLLLSES